MVAPDRAQAGDLPGVYQDKLSSFQSFLIISEQLEGVLY